MCNICDVTSLYIYIYIYKLQSVKLFFLIRPAREGDHQTAKMKVKWTKLGMVFFLLLSFVMTGCFIWQYRLPKAKPGKFKLKEKLYNRKIEKCLSDLNEWMANAYFE